MYYKGQVVLEMGDLKMAAFCLQHVAFMNGFKAAKSSSSGATNSDSSNPSSLSNDSSRLTQQNQSEQRATHLNNNSKLNNNKQPNQSTISHTVTQQALVYTFLKDYDKSIAILENELKLKPNAELCNLLGRILMKAKKWQLAVEAFDKSIEYNVLTIRKI